MMLPNDPLWSFDIKIVLQTIFFQSAYIPHSIIDILQSLPLSITGLDISFDYRTSNANSFTYKHNGNIKHQQLVDEHGHKSLYMGAFNPRRKNNRSIMYDRNEKEYSRDMSSHDRHIYSNRFEVKLKWKIGEQLLNDISHQQITDELKKRIFIVDIDEMDTNGHIKRKFKFINEDYDRLTSYYKANDRRKLRVIAKANRQPLEDIYNDNIHHLFSSLKYQDSYEIQAPTNKKTPIDAITSTRVDKHFIYNAIIAPAVETIK